MMMLPPNAGAIALNRFGLGARPDDALTSDPRKWLIGQFDRFEAKPAEFAQLPAAAALAIDYTQQIAVKRIAARDAGSSEMGAQARAELLEARRTARIETRDLYRAAVNARMASALATQAPFVERLTHFWSNHFALSTEKPQVAIYAGAYETDAIRAHVLGTFENMLVAVERHPAMLFYLDQFRSTGAGSSAATYVRTKRPDRPVPGLNENLAREIMELHTLGVRTGYTQADVTEFARALTGWSIAGIGPGPAGRNSLDASPGTFVFRPNMHEPGNRTIIGQTYGQEGEAQARAVLHDLATAPATAHHVSLKLARHFVADDPPPALVDRLTNTFLKTGGNLPALYETLVDSPEAWQPQPAKFKTPWEWSVSALRGLGRTDLGRIDVASMLRQLGQPVWRPMSPAGYDDIAASWAAPDALMRRVELAQRLAQAADDRIDARVLGSKLLPGTLSPATRTMLTQAENAPTALALLLVSPDFQRR